jgi:hypothetical protein
MVAGFLGGKERRMSRAKVLLSSLAAVAAIGVASAPGASAGNPCKPVKGVSRCVFGIETTPGGEPEPIAVGQTVEAEWWGRGSYFNAGRYSFLCKDVVFNGSVAGFTGGAPLLSTPTATFQGTEAGAACRTVMGAAQISADASGWQFSLSVKEQGAGQYVVTDQLKPPTGSLLRFTAVYTEPGIPTVTCTFQAKSVKGTWAWAPKQAIGGTTPAAPFALDTEASNSAQCPAKGTLETSWRYFTSPPAGGSLPLVLAIH